MRGWTDEPTKTTNCAYARDVIADSRIRQGESSMRDGLTGMITQLERQKPPSSGRSPSCAMLREPAATASGPDSNSDMQNHRKWWVPMLRL